ncbi:Gamma-glutamyl phosphate reductase [Clarias magur]|uniref:Gamma-glutamyl phosphate reductase n=1 Tax=Clarias magur TaxID=1594786 RepID=A0A8J4TRA2_CLAMG|nr:Gamma-glutamyl phosphate reductase [Clarias magur]
MDARVSDICSGPALGAVPRVCLLYIMTAIYKTGTVRASSYWVTRGFSPCTLGSTHFPDNSEAPRDEPVLTEPETAKWFPGHGPRGAAASFLDLLHVIYHSNRRGQL